MARSASPCPPGAAGTGTARGVVPGPAATPRCPGGPVVARIDGEWVGDVACRRLGEAVYMCAGRVPRPGHGQPSVWPLSRHMFCYHHSTPARCGRRLHPSVEFPEGLGNRTGRDHRRGWPEHTTSRRAPDRPKGTWSPTRSATPGEGASTWAQPTAPAAGPPSMRGAVESGPTSRARPSSWRQRRPRVTGAGPGNCRGTTARPTASTIIEVGVNQQSPGDGQAPEMPTTADLAENEPLVTP